MDRYGQLLQNEHIRRTLNTIRFAEGTSGPEGYRTMFGGGKFDVSGGWRHPDRVVHGGGYSSAAAGAYQFMPDTWAEWSKKVGVKDFSPESQDRVALALIEGKRGVSLDEIAKGGLKASHIHQLAPEWASLPTASGKSYYGQPVKDLGELQRVYGGEIGAGGGGGSASGGSSSAPQPGDDDFVGPVPTSKPATPKPIEAPDPITPQIIAPPRSIAGSILPKLGVGPGDENAPDSLPSGQRRAKSGSFIKQMLEMLMAS